MTIAALLLTQLMAWTTIPPVAPPAGHRPRVELMIGGPKISPAQAAQLRGELEVLVARQGTEAVFPRSPGSKGWAAEDVLVPFATTDGTAARMWLQFPDENALRLTVSIHGGDRFVFREVSLPSGMDVVGRETVAQVVASSIAAVAGAPGIGIDRAEARRRLGLPDPAPENAGAAPLRASSSHPPPPALVSVEEDVGCRWPMGGILGCGYVTVRSAVLTPWPEAIEPDVAIRVQDAGLGRLSGASLTDVREGSHLAVALEIENRTSTLVRVAIDESSLVLGHDGEGAARSFRSAASGTGALQFDLDLRGFAEPVVLEPGRRALVWVDFTGFARDSLFRPHVAVAVPVQIAGTTSWRTIVLSDPGRATPRWQMEPAPIWGMHLEGNVWHIPGGFDAFGGGFGGDITTGKWFRRFTVTAATLTNAYNDGRNHFGFGYGVQGGRTFSARLSPDHWISLAPTVGMQLAAFRHDATYGDRDSHPETKTLLGGAVLGLSLFLDKDSPASGPFPISGPRPRHGSLLAFQLAYVHWFGQVKNESVGWTGAGVMGSISFGLNTP